MPTLNTTGACRLAIALDGGTPQTLTGTHADGNSAWSSNVIAQTEKLAGTIQVTSAGMHTLKLFQVDASVVVDRIVVDTGGPAAVVLGPAGELPAIAPVAAPSEMVNQGESR